MIYVIEKKSVRLLLLVTIILLSSFSVGYAYLSQNLDINGSLSILPSASGTVVSSISPVKLKYMVMKIGTNALMNSVRLTLDKYDDKQCIYAIEKFILTGLLDGFTRDDGVRNKLGLVVPRNWLNDIMMNELDGKNKDIFKVINRLSNVDKKKIMSSIDNNFSDINEDEVSKIMEVRSYIEIIASSIYDSIFLKINKDDDKKIGRK